jgi:hypothetical protein
MTQESLDKGPRQSFLHAKVENNRTLFIYNEAEEEAEVSRLSGAYIGGVLSGGIEVVVSMGGDW